jgi:hypothetical protein
MSSWRSTLGGVLVGALALTTGCGSSVVSVSDGPVEPLVVGWQQYFRLSWQPELHGSRAVIQGRIYNDAGFPARGLVLLVEGLDLAGRATEQKLARLGTVSAGTAAPFEAPLERAAPQYRVSVYSFDWAQKD